MQKPLKLKIQAKNDLNAKDSTFEDPSHTYSGDV